jgi:nucleoside-triphosphatase
LSLLLPVNFAALGVSSQLYELRQEFTWVSPIARGRKLCRLASAAVEGPVRILLEGRPGSGKTTVARNIVARLQRSGIPATGFTTEELRERARRVGFAIEDLQGERAILASVDLDGPTRVGRYGVDLEALERVALPALEPSSPKTIVVIDELGKMELASAKLTERVRALLSAENDLVATIHTFKHPFTDELKCRSDVALTRVTKDSRGELPALVCDILVARRSGVGNGSGGGSHLPVRIVGGLL